MLGRFFKYWLPLAIWMLVIFAASSSLGTPQNTSRFIEPLVRWLAPNISAHDMDSILFFIRKTGHFGEYAVLACLLWRALRTQEIFASAGFLKIALLVVALSAFYAGTDEFHQFFVKERECSGWDVLLDSCGAGFATITLLCMSWRRKRI